MVRCLLCPSSASVKCAYDGAPLCAPCFISKFEEQVHKTIAKHVLFNRGERIAVGVSGGKDSTVLAYILNVLNKRYDYGVDLILLSIDEGIRVSLVICAELFLI
ncbi:hypothetical protein AB6A40_002008 [Gnathostoma spinigerum]|uniref:Cytoplasmic tRNA 2-thiolation protein 1 n=1 Tax=Gnathostoma spinigerum TaxID=75299 RepID=A0ABD6E5J2_9BILA